MKKTIVDGKSLCLDRKTGIVRVHIEILKRLDRLVKPDQIEILIPNNLTCQYRFKNIKVVKYGRSIHLIWRQFFFAIYVLKNKAVALNLSNSAPLLCPGVVCIHDINAVENPRNYSASLLSRVLNLEKWSKKIICKRSKVLFCPSEFTKSELLREFHCKNEKIRVINFGWQHYENIIPDNTCLNKYGVEKGSFYFSIGSLAKHKNFEWIINAAKMNKNCSFVIAGAADPKVFGYECTEDGLKGIKYVGYLTDEEAKAFMQNCKAFIFPSLYEGFGIPPLEALSVGTEVIASNIPVLREVLKGSVHYIDPYNANVDLDKKSRELLPASKNMVLGLYSWDKAAEQIWDLICEFS